MPCHFKVFYWKPRSCKTLHEFCISMHFKRFHFVPAVAPKLWECLQKLHEAVFFCQFDAWCVLSCWVFVDRHRQWQGQPLNLGTITFHFAALVSVLTLVPCSVSNRGPIRGMDGGKKQTLCIRLTFYIIYISGFPTQTLLFILECLGRPGSWRH